MGYFFLLFFSLFSPVFLSPQIHKYSFALCVTTPDQILADQLAICKRLHWLLVYAIALVAFSKHLMHLNVCEITTKCFWFFFSMTWCRISFPFCGKPKVASVYLAKILSLDAFGSVMPNKEVIRCNF